MSRSIPALLHLTCLVSFSHILQWLVWRAVRSVLLWSPWSLFSFSLWNAFLFFCRRIMCKKYLKAEHLFLAKDKRVRLSSGWSEQCAMFFKTIFLAAIFGLDALVLGLTTGRIPTVSDLSGWGRVLVQFRPPSQAMRYGGCPSIRRKLRQPKKRGRRSPRYSQASRKWVVTCRLQKFG